MSSEPRKRVVIVDDSPAYGDLWSNFILERYPDRVNVEAYSHPYDALPKIDATIDPHVEEWVNGKENLLKLKAERESHPDRDAVEQESSF